MGSWGVGFAVWVCRVRSGLFMGLKRGLKVSAVHEPVHACKMKMNQKLQLSTT